MCNPSGHYQPPDQITPDANLSRKKFSSDVEKINGYVPQVRVPGYAFPLLMCDIDDIGVDLIGWEDHFNPQNAYDMNNMIFDVPRMRDFKRKQLLERLKKGGDMVDDLNDFVADLEGDDTVSTFKNPCFHIVKHYPPATSNVKKYKPGEYRKKILLENEK